MVRDTVDSNPSLSDNLAQREILERSDVDDNLELVHLLRAVTVEFGLRQAEFAAANGMHPTDVRALICLLDAARAAEPATPGLLGTRLGLNSAGTTSVVDRLERLGHVERVRDPADRRRVLIRVRPEAVTLGQEFFGPMLNGVLKALTPLSPAERTTIHAFLTAAREAFTA
ncbi:MarR family transcriptional regulator [Streptomyces sp. W1SF4]|uniref:MarR family winged helix-turn-helix transcriptional regulator n=1 Tax=Streptomyces sp. W1SF4 TaxID=2305220 RepID=UPI000F701384|nr:MarR family transcriptional regulator [Streptomyces sp. W1SF4]AZM93037.1 MarR family transcriptional regulator [Streptomyces sp. W1SF4]